jgi:hypothetical protein
MFTSFALANLPISFLGSSLQCDFQFTLNDREHGLPP